MVQEYSDFTLYLYETYKNTHKRFILSNWETDNSIYCGSTWQFTHDSVFRQGCLDNYSQFGALSPDEALKALKLWFRIRAEGVADGRRRAASEVIGGSLVYLAVEFNCVHALHDDGFKSTLYDLIPTVPFDYVSYSAYESIDSAAPGDTLKADLDLIQDVAGTSSIIIGETGFDQSQPDSIAHAREVIAAALDWGVSYIIQWNLYDVQAGTHFGLFDVQGDPNPLYWIFREELPTGFAESIAGHLKP